MLRHVGRLVGKSPLYVQHMQVEDPLWSMSSVHWRHCWITQHTGFCWFGFCWFLRIMELCEEFFEANSPPCDTQSITDGVMEFVREHHINGRRIAMIAVRAFLLWTVQSYIYNISCARVNAWYNVHCRPQSGVKCSGVKSFELNTLNSFIPYSLVVPLFLWRETRFVFWTTLALDKEELRQLSILVINYSLLQ